MTRREIIAAWNAQADDMNSWHHLGEDEKLEWAMKLEREACANLVFHSPPSDEYESPLAAVYNAIKARSGE